MNNLLLNEIEREKLGWLLDAFKILNTNIGEARIYNMIRCSSW